MAAIKDVAKLSGFSPAAVSKYLKDPNSVRPDTRERIRSAIEELHYIPNASARSLRTGKTNLYLLMASHLRNPYFVDQFLGLNDEANRRGFNLLVQTAQIDEQADWNENADFYVPSVQQIDGVICLIAKEPKVLEQMQRMAKNVPVVAYSWPFLCPGLDTILVDMIGAIQECTEHLLAQGHTRIAYIRDHYVSAGTIDKIDGYRHALSQYGISPNPDYSLVSPPSTAGAYLATQRLMTLPTPPTAIVCENDVLAMGALEYARDHNIDVPRELAVVGQDDSSITRYAVPPLTSTSAPQTSMAIAAFDMLAARREDFHRPQQCVSFRPQLMIRKSSQWQHPLESQNPGGI